MILFIVKLNRNCYCLEAQNPETYYDKYIAKELDIDFNEYKVILTSCNGNVENTNNIYFEKRKDAKMAIKKLEPYLVMAKLMEV